MNSITTDQRAWSSQHEESMDAMAQISNDLDDLSNIFNIGDFDLDAIPNVEAAQFGEQIQHSHPNTPFVDRIPQSTSVAATQAFTTQDGFSLSQDVDGELQGQLQYQTQDGDHHLSTVLPYNSDSLYQTTMSRPFHDNHQQQQYAINAQHPFTNVSQIPPTPNSFEMHGESGRFLHQQLEHHQQQQRAILEQVAQLRSKQQQQHQAQFTPMTSPAGTPQYAVQPEFTTPGAYFSPLTSPALHAQMPSSAQHALQQKQKQQQGFYIRPSTAPNSTAPSPMDPNADVEMTNGATLPESANTQTKKSRRKVATPRSVGPVPTRPRQSPISKPQKRKSAVISSILPSRDLDRALIESQLSHVSQAGSAGVQVPQAFDSSESGSISPEPLSEALMGPPPRPASLTHSPALNAQKDHSNHPHTRLQSASGAAATPKSILSMRSHQSVDGSSSNAPSSMSQQSSLDDLQLPEAASKQKSRRSSLTRIDTAVPGTTTSKESTPRLSARKTPKFGPLSTPSAARPPSASASPGSAFSPMTASTPTVLLKDQKSDGSGASRSNKKRGSTSAAASAMVSPALRPKISPSIKPLLPEGSTLHSPTHALLLASKSNYQNLLEGNHLPGVNYPDSLSTGLTSKRTSHKVAEQGRRNRINEALKEMQALIPSPNIAPKSSSDDTAGSREEDGSPEAAALDTIADDGDTKESKESAAAKSSSSKAATVESANRYIRHLKDSDMSQKAAILELKRENDEMRRRLAEATGVFGSDASDATTGSLEGDDDDGTKS